MVVLMIVDLFFLLMNVLDLIDECVLKVYMLGKILYKFYMILFMIFKVEGMERVEIWIFFFGVVFLIMKVIFLLGNYVFNLFDDELVEELVLIIIYFLLKVVRFVKSVFFFDFFIVLKDGKYVLLGLFFDYIFYDL